jgi:hypothetical protein
MSTRKVIVFWEEPATGFAFEVRCLVTPGYPGSRDEPAEGPEVELLSVRDERGQDRPDVLSLLNSDFFGELEDAAIYEVQQRDSDDYEDAQERRRSGLRSVLADITGIPARGRA